MSASTTSVESSSTSSTDSKDTFLYFAFGSNLNSKRIHVNNPSAKRKGVGLLKNYRLDFNRYSERWKGSVATVVPDQDEEVWGALWEIDVKDMDNLDSQEGVHIGWYRVFQPQIQTNNDNQTVQCRSYHLIDQPPKQTPLPEERYPSKLYHEVIVEGAVETQVPREYLKRLENIPHRAAIPDAEIPKDKVVI
uniref:gamma-glutamylcyclotransferase n=1 Tax=Cacopsylla melanoneura TaxID=428564 RepID=A0A8D9B8X9_9HEMI